MAIIGCDTAIFENKIDTILVPVDNVSFLSVSSASISDSTWTKTPSGKPIRLFIGGFEGYKAAALLSFEYLDTLLDTLDIKSLILELTITNAIGVQSKESMLLSLYKNRKPWDEDRLSALDLNEFIDSLEDTIRTATVHWQNPDSAVAKFSFDIPLDSVQSWIDSPDKHGFIIVGDSSSNFIISSSLPSLQVAYLDSDTTKTESIFATSSGYLLSITTGLPLSDPERTYIGGGKAYRGIYKFNSGLLDGISETSKISRAELNIAIDSSRSILPNKNSSVTGIGLTLYFSYLDTSSESNNLFPTPISDSTKADIPADGNILSLNMTDILQKWITGDFENKGLVIWSGSEGSQLFRVALYGDGCDVVSDPTCVEPELNIYYVTSEGIEE